MLQVALDSGIPLASSCGGEGVCRACRVRVVHGNDQLSSPDAVEAEAAAEAELDPDERLACLARVLGPVGITTTYW